MAYVGSEPFFCDFFGCSFFALFLEPSFFAFFSRPGPTWAQNRLKSLKKSTQKRCFDGLCFRLRFLLFFRTFSDFLNMLKTSIFANPLSVSCCFLPFALCRFAAFFGMDFFVIFWSFFGVFCGLKRHSQQFAQKVGLCGPNLQCPGRFRHFWGTPSEA